MVLPRTGRRKTGAGQRIQGCYETLKPSEYAPLPLVETTT